MNIEHIPELIAKIALADPRVKRTDPIERRAQIEMWAGILADVPVPFALHAAQAHYAESQWPITAGDIATRWKAVVTDRMRRETGTFEPSDHPDLDPDDISGYLHALRERRQAVALGELPPSELKALIAGASAAEASRRVAQLGDYLTTETRRQLAPYRPLAAERERRLTDGQPDPLSVACPVETCRAVTGQPCTRPSRGDGRVRLQGFHGSRSDLAAGGREADEDSTPGAWPQGGTQSEGGESAA
ncbi:zinc finger domain-containing protein [Streptomyces parvulus]|uniref:zinc finger domain-containing protein n=1 Tax=Streptomyces parvulus TaxID=146923 RepID=UPI0033BEC57C